MLNMLNLLEDAEMLRCFHEFFELGALLIMRSVWRVHIITTYGTDSITYSKVRGPVRSIILCAVWFQQVLCIFSNRQCQPSHVSMWLFLCHVLQVGIKEDTVNLTPYCLQHELVHYGGHFKCLLGPCPCLSYANVVELVKMRLGRNSDIWEIIFSW